MTLPWSWLRLSRPLSPLLLLLLSFPNASCIQNSLRLCRGRHGVQPRSPFRTKDPSPHLLGVLPADISHNNSLQESPVTRKRPHPRLCSQPEGGLYLITGQCGWYLMNKPSEAPPSFTAPHVICWSLCCKNITIELPLIPNFAFHTPHRFFPKNTH